MKLALFARLEAKPGKEQEVADFHALLDSVQDPVISVVRRP